MKSIVYVLFLGVATTALLHAQKSRFDEFDANQDGKITPEEMPNPQVFGKLDSDQNGVIELKEIAEVIKRGKGTAQVKLAMPEEPAFDAYRDVPYAEIEGVDPKFLSLDIYSPEGAAKAGEKHPVMIMIHGGGWRNGDKAGLGAKRAHFVGAGYVYVSINYRLSPQQPQEGGITHPTHAEDCARALAWLHDHISEYGGDPDQLHLMGHSAGGHLAGLLGTNDRFLKAQGKDLSILKSNVLLDPAGLDIPRFMSIFTEDRRPDLFLHIFGDEEAGWIDASPQQHVASGKSIPPTLIFHAGERMVLDLMGPDLAQAITETGAPSKAVDTVTLSHSQINQLIGRVDDPMTALIMRLHAGEDASQFPEKLQY